MAEAITREELQEMAETVSRVQLVKQNNNNKKNFLWTAGHEKSRQAFGLIVIILAKRAAKQSHKVTGSTRTKNIIVKLKVRNRKTTERSTVRPKRSKMVCKTTIYSHAKNGCPKWKAIKHSGATSLKT